VPAPESLLDRDELVRLPGESEAQWYAQVARAVRAADPGPFALLAERKHPLVRFGLWQSRWSMLGVAAVGFASLAISAALFAFSLAGGKGNLASTLAALLVNLLPLGIVVWAFLGSAASVLGEREKDTVWQLVLTPVPRRVIAAGKVVPAGFRAALCCLLCLPLYALAGGLCLPEHPGSIALFPLPLRLATLAGFAYTGWGFTITGLCLGPVMCASDMVLAWAAAHWGAAYAVRQGSLGRVSLCLVGRLALVGLEVMVCLGITGGFILACIPLFEWMAEQPTHLWGLLVTIICGMVGLGILALWGAYALYKRWLLRAPVRAAVREFALFDRLADEEFRPLPFRIALLPPWFAAWSASGGQR